MRKKEKIISNLKAMNVKTIESKNDIAFHFKDGFIKTENHSVVIKCSSSDFISSLPFSLFLECFIEVNHAADLLFLVVVKEGVLNYKYRFKTDETIMPISIIDKTIDKSLNKNYTFIKMIEIIKTFISEKKTINNSIFKY